MDAQRLTSFPATASGGTSAATVDGPAATLLPVAPEPSPPEVVQAVLAAFAVVPPGVAAGDVADGADGGVVDGVDVVDVAGVGAA